jgi:hypothetical protein
MSILLAQWAGSCGHYIVIYIVLVKIWTNKKQRLQEPNQDQPHSPMYIGSFFIHTFKGWCECQSYLPNGQEVVAIT